MGLITGEAPAWLLVQNHQKHFLQMLAISILFSCNGFQQGHNTYCRSDSQLVVSIANIDYCYCIEVPLESQKWGTFLSLPSSSLQWNSIFYLGATLPSAVVLWSNLAAAFPFSSKGLQGLAVARFGNTPSELLHHGVSELTTAELLLFLLEVPFHKLHINNLEIH